MTTDWLCKHHNDLGKEQLYAILELRSKVFVAEQKCAYQDVDGQDLTGDTLHVMGWQDDQLVAYADAGKTCSSKADCTGQCLASGDTERVPGAKASGTCQRDVSQNFGCRQRIDGGVAQGTICVD